MKKAVFYFEFSNNFEVDYDEEPDVVYYGFNMEVSEDALDDYGYSEFDMDWEEFCCNMEDGYGTHDWSSSPHDEVEGFGYSAYEAEFARIPELMEKWRAYIESRHDFSNTTEVVKIDITVDEAINMSDKDFYDRIAEQVAEHA